MKKISLLLILILLLPVSAAAQVVWGVRSGIAYSSLVQKVDDRAKSGARFGYSIAGIAEIPVWNEFSLRPEVVFMQQGGHFLSNPDRPGESVEVANTQVRRDYRYYSIQVPVNICYTFTFSEININLFGGPVLDFPLSGKVKMAGGKGDMQFGSEPEDDIKSFDLGISVGLGAEYANFFCSINAICGTLDRRAHTDAMEKSVYQNNVTLSLGYFFRTK
ncbi:PorT family protein [Parabacteroides sp. OttesenSCG-928-G07]|nr:PorT family protein [Parabacteroides sp. OttesenSCG-928-G07]